MKVLAISEHTGPGKAIREVVKELRNHPEFNTVVFPTVLTENLYTDFPERRELPAYSVSELRGENMDVPSLEGFIDDLLTTEKPDIILTGSANPSQIIDRTLVAKANLYGMHSVVVTDFWCWPDIYKKRFPSEETIPDVVCCIDEIDKNNLLAAGIPEGKIVITGQPAFDGLKEQRAKYTIDKIRLMEELGFANVNPEINQLLLTYCPDPLYSDVFSLDTRYPFSYNSLDSMVRAFSSSSVSAPTKLNVNILPHPKDILTKKKDGLIHWGMLIGEVLGKQGDYSAYGSDIELRIGRKDMQSDVFNPSLLSSDLVVINTSTTGAECLYMGALPVAIIQPGLSYDQSGLKHFIDAGIIPAANTKDASSSLIHNLLFNPEFRSDYVSRQKVYGDKPSSAPAVVEQMKKLFI
nr:hypothetical protein [Nanoarchaeum sp.]